MSPRPSRSLKPRRALLARAALTSLLASLAACGAQNSPCLATCAPIEGTYALAFQSDGSPDDCQALGISLSDGALAITRVGSRLNATFARGDQLDGTLYDTNDFTLSATTGQGDSLDSVSVRGTWRVPLHAGDKPGVDGTWFETHQRPSSTGTKSCAIDRTFTGALQ